MAPNPAFTSVAARRTLGTNGAPALPLASNSFSPAVIEYVQRAFFEFQKVRANPAFTGIADNDIRNKLHEVVNKIKTEGKMDTLDWSVWPLPHDFILQDRHNAALTVNRRTNLANIKHSATPTPPSGLSSPDTIVRKRKSPEYDMTPVDDEPVTPPWKKQDNKASLADRNTGKSKTQEKKRKNAEKLHGAVVDTSAAALERRRQRFGDIAAEPSPYLPIGDSLSADPNAGPIVGTCQKLEKNYFRLTAPPNPSTVRPLPILEKAWEHVASKWEQQHDYNYVCDQLKSIRQDLTVQRIKAKFTIRVYEGHARIALQMKDLGEYNQCQTQLRALYKLRLGEGGGSGGSDDEFLAYRVLYLIYTKNRTDMNNMLADLTQADKRRPFVDFALKVRAALASGDYHKLLKLYRISPSFGLTQYLMAMFIERERLTAMAVICRAYKPDIGLDFLAGELFAAESSADSSQQCHDFICTYQGESLLQRKDDGSCRVLTGKAGGMFEQAKKTAFGVVDIKGQI